MTSRDVSSYSNSYNLIILSLNYFPRSCRLKRRWSRTWWATQSTTSSTSRRCKTPSDSWVADFQVFSFFAVLVFPLISTRWVWSTIKHLYCRLSLSSAAVDRSQNRTQDGWEGNTNATSVLCPFFFSCVFLFCFWSQTVHIKLVLPQVAQLGITFQRGKTVMMHLH